MAVSCCPKFIKSLPICRIISKMEYICILLLRVDFSEFGFRFIQWIGKSNWIDNLWVNSPRNETAAETQIELAPNLQNMVHCANEKNEQTLICYYLMFDLMRFADFKQATRDFGFGIVSVNTKLNFGVCEAGKCQNWNLTAHLDT